MSPKSPATGRWASSRHQSPSATEPCRTWCCIPGHEVGHIPQRTVAGNSVEMAICATIFCVTLQMSVIGTNYLGATHAAGMAEFGHHVIGVDIDVDRVKTL